MDDKPKLTVVVVSAALLIPLVAAIAIFTDTFAEAFPVPAVIEGLLGGAGIALGFGVVNLLTLSPKWRKPVAGAIALVCGLLLAGVLYFMWTFFNGPPMPGWMIWIAKSLPEFTPQVGYWFQMISGLALGVFAAALIRLFQKPWQERSKRQEVWTALLAIGAGLIAILSVAVLS